MRIFIAVLLILLAGCGATRSYKDFNLSKVDKSLGVIIGKVDIEYNSRPFGANRCRFCISRDCHQLLGDGYVFMPVGKYDVTNVLLVCGYPDVGRGDHLFEVGPFEVKPGIIYLGNLVFSVSSRITKSYTTYYPKYEEHTHYELFATVTVEDDMEDVVKVFRQQVKRKDIPVEKNLLDIYSNSTTQQIHTSR